MVKYDAMRRCTQYPCVPESAKHAEHFVHRANCVTVATAIRNLFYYKKYVHYEESVDVVRDVVHAQGSLDHRFDVVS